MKERCMLELLRHTWRSRLHSDLHYEVEDLGEDVSVRRQEVLISNYIIAYRGKMAERSKALESGV